MRTPADREQRQRAVYADRSILVQAPAGSGKTRLLTQRYLRLLACVDAPERIIALTFTRRAAAEMRARVLSALHSAGESGCPESIDEDSWNLARAAVAHLIANGIDSMECAMRLRIETIDSFNAWITQQLPMAAGAGSRFKVAANPQRLYREAAAGALMDSPHSDFLAAIDDALELFDQDASQLRNHVARMLASREQWLPILAVLAGAAHDREDSDERRVRENLDADLQIIVKRVMLKAADVIGDERMAALSALLQYASDAIGSQSPLLLSWRTARGPLGPHSGDVDRWREMAAFVLTSEGKLRKTVNVGQGFPPASPQKSAMLDLLEELDASPAVLPALRLLKLLPGALYDERQWSNARSLAATLVLAAAELDRLFQERGRCDFAAISMAASRALGAADAPTDLALRLDYSLQHILLDEFQDTSYAQLELLRILTAGWQPGDGRTVFCVGDPMQSIYGFRDAEVRAFLELADVGIGDVRFELLQLSSNFRSQPQIVVWNNRSFERIFPSRNDRDRGAIAFIPALPAGPELASPEPRVTACEFADPQAEGRWIAELVSSHLSRARNAKIAILVRRRHDAGPIVHALRTRGIGFSALDIESLQERPVARDIITLTRALIHRGDRTAWLALLRAPWSGLTLEDLDALAVPAETIWQNMNDPSCLATLSQDGAQRVSRVADALRDAFRARGESTWTRWIEKTWLALGGPLSVGDERELHFARAAFDRLSVLESDGVPDPAEIESQFERLYANDSAGTAAGTTAGSAVEIMTIHRAKGLEFDVVIVPALNVTPRGASQEDILLTHQFAGTEGPGFILAVRSSVERSDSLVKFVRELDADAARLEAERLIYVACTRASEYLYLTAVTAFKAESKPHFTPKANSLLAILWPIVGESFGGFAKTPAEARERSAQRLRRLPAMIEFDAAAVDHGEGVHDVLGVESPPFDWAGEAARQIGTWVHAQLQNLDMSATSSADCAARFLACRRWLAARGVPDSLLDAAAQRAIDALTGVCTHERGRWLFSKEHRESSSEFALSVPLEDEIVRVVFDRSFVDANGVRWVIDYKTSAHSGADLDQFLDAEVLRYRPQMDRYAGVAARLGGEPIRLALYFPLLRAWREWSYEP